MFQPLAYKSTIFPFFYHYYNTTALQSRLGLHLRHSGIPVLLVSCITGLLLSHQSSLQQPKSPGHSLIIASNTSFLEHQSSGIFFLQVFLPQRSTYKGPRTLLTIISLTPVWRGMQWVLASSRHKNKKKIKKINLKVQNVTDN